MVAELVGFSPPLPNSKCRSSGCTRPQTPISRRLSSAAGGENNRNRCYIPEWLLEAWDIPVDTDFNCAA
jgi:hypothetical protein